MFNKIICASIICVLSAASLAKNDLPYKEGRILVRFAPKSDKSKRTNIENNQILASVNVGTVKESLDFVPGLAVVKLPPNLSVEQALARLKNNPEILYAEPDYKLEFRSTYPNDYYFDALWAFENNHGTEDADIDAPEAWDIVTDSHIIVAVIDSGIDYTHPDLAENIWLNQAELNGLPGVDDDNNGYIDDIRGWNFDPDVNDNDPMDLYGHGTMIAGIIGAVGNNGLGVTGVCWRVKLMAVNISEYDDMDWHLLASSAVKGINYAVNNGAKVINASWGGSTPIQALEDAIEAADNNSVLIIAAVPNKYWLDMDVSPDYPSWYNFDNIISVLATNTNDNKSNYSAYGQTKVDLGAPGGEYNGNPWGDSMIWSTVPGGGYDFSQGTSYATPYVSGACALVWAANPKLTHYQVREAILSSVDVKLSLSDKCASGGRLNLYKAVTYFPIPVRLTITADVNDCIAPLTTINYNIHYDPNGFDDTNVYIIDELPVGVEYLSSNPAGNYDPFNGTVTWEIPSFGPNNPGDITLTVAVTEAANPGSTLINICKIIGDSFRKSASVNTCVDCWSGSIIYVDPNAPVGGNGRSWSSAYKNIQTAIDAAERDVNCPSREIWIKTGEYKPVNDTGVPYWYNYSFELFDDLSLIGHFEGCENRPAERKLNNPAFETILQGQISAGNKVYNIVKADNVNNAVLDGFIINNAAQEGLKIAANSNIAVANCTLKQNIYGMKLEQNTCADIYNCKFINNYCYGIEAHASAANLSGCLFKNNTDSGIYAESCDSLAVSKTSFDGNG
ncbi:MAG: S8 family serine peptidase, partial [Phycisphaerae bacterium]